MDKAVKKIALLFRTHVLDETVLASFRHLQENAPENVDLFFCCDETAGQFDLPEDVRKFGHTKDFSAEHRLLYFLPQRHLWHNGDYPFYFFYDKYPNYDLYLMIEFDVYFTDRALKTFFNHIQFTDADMHAVFLREAREKWLWRRAASLFNENVYQIFGPIIGLSNRAVARLFTKRLLQTKMFEDNLVNDWPNVEAFVPTEVKAAGFTVDCLSDSLNMPKSDFGTSRLHLAESLSRDEDTDLIRHPVLNREAFLPKLHRISGKQPLVAFLQERPRLKRLAQTYSEQQVRASLESLMEKPNLKKLVDFLFAEE